MPIYTDSTIRIFGVGSSGDVLARYVIPAVGVFLFYKFKRNKPAWPVRFLVISCWTVLWWFIALGVTRPQITPRDVQRSQLARIAEQVRAERAKAAKPLPPTKWDAAIRSFYGDLSAFHAQYVSAISKLDATAIPLFTPDSFRDAATIKQVISQLQDRLVVANEFASPESLLDKMPAYVGDIDAAEEERRSFLDGFDSSTRRNLAAQKVMLENEREWLRNSMVLYQFVLTRQGEYSLQDGNVVFKRRGLADDFERKLEIAQLRRLQFLTAQGQFLGVQNKLLAQAGMPPL